MKAGITDDWPQGHELFVADSTHRLILASYADVREPALGSLVDDADLEAIVRLSAATNRRLMTQAGLPVPSGLTPGELLYDVPYSKVINAAFAYPGDGARFSSSARGAWYCAYDADTCVEEVAFHRLVHLAETGVFDDEVDYQDYLADVHSSFVADLQDADPRTLACLDPDSYRDGQVLADRLLSDERPWSGVVYPSVRHAGGTCLAVFRPSAVSMVRLGLRYRLVIRDGELAASRTI